MEGTKSLMIENESERICFNCNQFFPASMGEATEFGVCLNDKAFEPYIDELLENRKTAACRKLVDSAKFSGEREACSKFEEVERIEIDDDSPLGHLISRSKETGELDPEALYAVLLEEQSKNIDWKTIPVDEYAATLRSSNPEERNSAISSLGGLISFGNREAFNELLDYFKTLPPPTAIEDVHFKIDILLEFRKTTDNT